MGIKDLVKIHNNKYNSIFETKAYFASGRVNLIGGHVDYHGGTVLPCAINYGTKMIISKRGDKIIKGYSENFDKLGVIKCSLDNLEYKIEDDWFNYIKGVLKLLRSEGRNINKGFEITISGNIPNGAGLSSSASLEIVILEALNNEFNLKMGKLDMVLIAQKMENKYIGVNTGIMDQYAIAFGKEKHAMLIDCEKKTHKYVKLDFNGLKLLIINTNIRRELADSKYNKRRMESYKGLSLILLKTNKNKFNELTIEDFEKYKEFLESNIQRKRTYHFISENQRVKEANYYLAKNEIYNFGKLIYDSHKSLKNYYGVSCKELDYLVDILKPNENVLGSRMTGAGFGGCTINIVKENAIDEITREVILKYKEKFGFKPTIHVVKVGDGSSVVELT